MKKQFVDSYTWVPNWSMTPVMQSTIYTVQTTFDALNRPISITQPDSTVITNFYNKGGLLEKVKQGSTEYISNIEYNARGQRTDIYYGNGSKTAYTYDTENFRLTRLLTTKNSGQVTLQDLNYTYDSVGNITEVEDDAQQTVYFDNSVIDPISTYEYDALYRLIEATGREKGGLNSAPSQADLAIVSSIPYNNQSNDVSNYTQTFEYDKLGNILNMSSQNKWSRDYFYDTATNRLLKHDEQGQPVYTYDEHGNMLTMPGISEMDWDFGDKLNKTVSGTVTSYYNYDSGGERTRKVVLKQGGIREERYYINGYEVYRKFISDVIETERQTLHIADDRKRFAIIDTLTIENGVALGTPDVTIRYQYDNHLGSASLELDESANVISYEEYHPFGTSSYRLGANEAEVQLKRYRYVGKERDEETGLYYYGARFYAAWIARFVSCDPLQHEYPHYTPYQYAGNKPVTYIDLDGLEEASNDDNNKRSYFFTNKSSVEGSSSDNSLWYLANVGSFSEMSRTIANESMTTGRKPNFLVVTVHGNEEGIVAGPSPKQDDSKFDVTSDFGMQIRSVDLRRYIDMLDKGGADYYSKWYKNSYFNTQYFNPETGSYENESITARQWTEREGQYISDLIDLINSVEKGGVFVLGGCNVGQAKDFLELLYSLTNQQVSIMANTAGFKASGQTDGDRIFNRDIAWGDWAMVGPTTNGYVETLNSFRLEFYKSGNNPSSLHILMEKILKYQVVYKF
ncbi:MAG: RHS repeat-associated core domain-containing protein [Bacteroidales bacterium]|nr:RHS repeat-associated core domain-containing protein [Bacteroidales bacterium]